MVKPRSLSATAVSTFEDCPARWAAEHHMRARGASTSAADLGSAAHDALEYFVKAGHHTDKKSLPQLEKAFYKAYYERFSSDERYEEGLEMMRKWHKRSVPLPDEVISTEVKENFDIPSSKGPITFNYILDRFDRIEDHVYRVVDYKSSQLPMSPDALRRTIQARCYGLAAQIKFPDAERIWVTFDLLRHESVGQVFTREDNKATWRYLKNVVERIIEMPGDKPPEKLNPHCNWCVRKSVCKTLQRAESVGAGLTQDPLEAADRRAALTYASKGLKAAIEELDKVIVAHCEREGLTEFTTDTHEVKLGLNKKRDVDGGRVKELLPDELVSEYSNIGITVVQKMLKDDRIDEEIKAAIKGLIEYRFGNSPTVKTEPLVPVED